MSVDQTLNTLLCVLYSFSMHELDLQSETNTAAFEMTWMKRASPSHVHHLFKSLLFAERKIFIGMIPKDLNEADLMAMFNVYGDIEECVVTRESDGRSKGWQSNLYAVYCVRLITPVTSTGNSGPKLGCIACGKWHIQTEQNACVDRRKGGRSGWGRDPDRFFAKYSPSYWKNLQNPVS